MTSISVAEVQQLQQQVATLSPSNSAQVESTLRSVYGSLQEAGFSYAGWARGVVEQNTVAGISAMQFLTGTALAGLDSLTCQSLTQQQIDQLKIDLADAYLRQLMKIGDASSSVDRDINAQEVWDMATKRTTFPSPVGRWMRCSRRFSRTAAKKLWKGTGRAFEIPKVTIWMPRSSTLPLGSS